MTFDTAGYLRRATGRAKSDVANKLVAMFLHDISKRICNLVELSVGHPEYTKAVSRVFEAHCCYCARSLEKDRAAVEHPDGMNRFRLGLHIPGNVVVACKRCNCEKRRDDSASVLVLAESGWESFLSHDSTACSPKCRTCGYWREVLPDVNTRMIQMKATRMKISSFRLAYKECLDLNAKARVALAAKVDSIYRDCQQFAESRIKNMAEAFLRELS